MHHIVSSVRLKPVNICTLMIMDGKKKPNFYLSKLPHCDGLNILDFGLLIRQNKTFEDVILGLCDSVMAKASPEL